MKERKCKTCNCPMPPGTGWATPGPIGEYECDTCHKRKWGTQTDNLRADAELVLGHANEGSAANRLARYVLATLDREPDAELAALRTANAALQEENERLKDRIEEKRGVIERLREEY